MKMKGDSQQQAFRPINAPFAALANLTVTKKMAMPSLHSRR
jgi:hypothetical protein